MRENPNGYFFNIHKFGLKEKKKKNFSRVYIRATSNTTWTKNIISPLEP